MNNSLKPGRLVAVIGKRERLRPALSAEFPAGPGCAVLPEAIPCDPSLSIRDNVQQLRMMAPAEDSALFEALLALTGLEQHRGWKRPFRGDMTAEKKLYAVFAAMLPKPETLLIYDVPAEMNAAQRAAFAQMAERFCGSGSALVYTASDLKSVMQLELRQEIWLPGPDGFRKTDAEAIAESSAMLLTPGERNAYYRELEAGEI